MKKIMKRLAAGACALALAAFGMAQPVCAAVNNGTVYPIDSNEIAGWPQMGELNSETAVLMDADTGVILASKGMDEARYPASITKVMTVLLALENCELSDKVTFTEEGLARMWEGTNINSQVGEELTIEQCVNILMIVSANEVAAQVAIHVAGSEAKFAEMMNKRARELGCLNTHFNNASGLPDESHYTTAHDMALIFREALRNPKFQRVISERSYNLTPTNLNPEVRSYTTHLPMVIPDTPEYYDKCIGGKTGLTQAAMSTLVTAAQQDDRTLIAVVMRAADASHASVDSRALYEYGFSNFKNREIDGGCVVLPGGVKVGDLRTEEEESDGVVQTSYFVDEHLVGTSEAEATPEPTQEEEAELPEESDEAGTWIETDNPMLEHKGFAATAGAIGGLAVLGILLIIIKLIGLIRR